MPVKGVNNANFNQTKDRVPSKDLGKDEFLKILVAQLKNPDPLSGGGDQTEYVSQLAQFSSLEQMQNLNTNLEAGFSMMIYYQNIQYANQLISKNVILSDGKTKVEGIVERVSMSGGDILIIIDGKAYGLEYITQVGESKEGGEEDSEESPEQLPEGILEE